jgi:predicted nucleic-acid-binding Zn-ribbon protein
MNFTEAIRLSKKYAECPKCGNGNIEAGEGTLDIDDNSFERTCKCGWSKTVKGDPNP